MGKAEGPRSGSGLKCTLHLTFERCKNQFMGDGMGFGNIKEDVEEGEPPGPSDWVESGVVSKRVSA